MDRYVSYTTWELISNFLNCPISLLTLATLTVANHCVYCLLFPIRVSMETVNWKHLQVFSIALPLHYLEAKKLKSLEAYKL